MSSENRFSVVIKQLAVYKVITRGTNHKENVPGEFHISGYVTKPLVGDAIICNRKQNIMLFVHHYS